MIDERRMNDVRTNTLDVVVEPNGDKLRTSTVEGNAHTSIPIADVLLPSGHGDHVKIPHVNLSMADYEPHLLRTLVGMRSPSMRTQEISTIPLLDGPGSLLMRDPIERRTHETSRPAEQESSQEDTYIPRTTTTRDRE